MKSTFRTAVVGGFNRQDVTNYIAGAAAEATEKIRLLEQERDEYAGIAAERDRLAAEAESLQAQLDQLSAELEQEHSVRDLLDRETAERSVLAEKLAALEAEAAEYRSQKERIAQVELDAHRRAEELLAQAEQQAAELLERARAEADAISTAAREEAAAVRSELQDKAQSVSAAYAQLLRDFDVVKTHMTGELRKMDVAFTQLPLVFNKVGAELKELEKKILE